jgi:hypothetical protein
MMNGSQPYGPTGNPGPLRRIHLRGAAQRFLSPHPDPLPEEREQRARHRGKPTPVDYFPIGEGFTLSRGERAGVRGNGAKSLLAYRTNPRIVELGESSGTARGFPECS